MKWNNRRANTTNRWAVVNPNGKILHVCLDTYSESDAEEAARAFNADIAPVVIVDRRTWRELNWLAEKGRGV